MTYEDLQTKITTPYFLVRQVARLFPGEPAESIRIQLSRFEKRGLLVRMKQGIYVFADRKIDNLALANIVYQPSYVSTDTAMNIYGMIPDIPAAITSVTMVTPNTFTTPRGVFDYSCLSKNLYFGYTQQTDPLSGLSYNLAEPEKALLDWVYLRKLKSLEAMRVDQSQISDERLNQFMSEYPSWVGRTIHE